MAANPLIAFRVSPETKASLHALAQSRSLTDCALLQKLVEMVLLQQVGASQAQATSSVQQAPRGSRLYVRLRTEDHLLLRERANGRGLAAATYASMLLRAHLRSLTPPPDRELARVERTNSFAFRWDSRSETFRLTVGSGIRRCRLAAEKLPAEATATNTDIDSRRSMGGLS
jgi:hypothetical protein